MSNKTTVEIIPVTDVKSGDTLIDDQGRTMKVTSVFHQEGSRYRGLSIHFAEGVAQYDRERSVLRVVSEEPAEEEPVLPNADFIRIIRGTESGDRIDGSLAHRMGSLRRFRLLDGPRAGAVVGPTFEGDAIFEWEEVVAVAKSAILAGLGTADDEPKDNDANANDDEEESEDEDEDECDGSCLACILRRLFAAAAGEEDAA